MNDHNEAISNTPYDDAFRTLVTKGGNLIIPFINEMFRGERPVKMNASIVHEANEQFLNLEKGKQDKYQTDSMITIDGELYHIECQTRDDGTILVRIAKYYWLEAMRNSRVEGDTIHIPLPYSGILYLRKTPQTPEKMFVHYYDNYGNDLKYPVKVINLADYTLDELIEKNLTFLLPFYLFNLEDNLKDYNKEASREKIITFYDELFQYLNKLREQEKLNVYQYSLITDMLRKVTDNLAQSNERARKELDEFMGGKILEFNNERLLNEGGIKDLLSLVHDGLLNADVAADRAAKEYGISKEDFKKRLDSYQPNDELMQG